MSTIRVIRAERRGFGVTRASLSEARGRAVSPGEVMALTQAEAAEIYRRSYWAPAGCAGLPEGLDLVALDMAVNMGPRTSARLLQAALGVTVDGAIGPRTLAAAGSRPAADVIRTACELRRQRYRALAGFAAFGPGWLNRTDAVQALALAWAGEADTIEGATHVA